MDRRAEIIQAQQEGDIRKDVKWHVATKRGLIKAMPGGPLKALTVLVERKKAQIRALVEHRNSPTIPVLALSLAAGQHLS